MFIVVNLKAYDCDPIAVATAVGDVADDTTARLAVAPQPTDIAAVADHGVETWAQHVDSIDSGSHTGHVRPRSVANAGATGTLLNHSERRRTLAEIDGAISRADDVGLETIVCANNPAQISAVSALSPTAVAVEPPELIGSGTPVSQADPEIVREAVAGATAIDESVSVLCGAGISSGDDVAAASELGSDGVLLASGVALADDPARALNGLVAGVHD